MIIKDNLNSCDRCGEDVVTDHKRGIIICQSCGKIKTDRFIDKSSEYRYFIENTTATGKDPRRVGSYVNTKLDS